MTAILFIFLAPLRIWTDAMFPLGLPDSPEDTLRFFTYILFVLYNNICMFDNIDILFYLSTYIHTQIGF